jgi:CRP-like cAMP-binding protein
MSEAKLPAESLQLEAVSELAHYHRGQFIYLPGDPSDAVYLIRRGRVRLSFIDEAGERQTLAILGKREFFGELILEGFVPHEFSAEALTETSVYVIDKWKLSRAIGHEPLLARRLSELLGYRRDLLLFYQH